MRDPSEKIHSQIRRPSFSGSLLTRIRRESLRGRRNTIWGPNVHFHAPAVFQIRKCFRHPVKIRSVGQTISFARRRRSGARGHSICCVEAGLYRGCLRVRPFKCSHSTTLTICSGGATSAPKSAEGALRGCRTAPSPTTGTIRRYCAHHTRRYISHPDEEGERQFRFAPFGQGWKKASGRGRVRALTAIQSWPLIHFLLRVSGGRRISAQRQLRMAATTYGALHALRTTTLQFGPSRWKILSPLQMDTPYEI